jgi:thiol-disulfide isomerase/thioredoxin/uncharacterized membrane protein YphA (DoxX/SURF4 family)
MNVVALIVRLAIAAAFLVAGLSKLLDLAGTRRSLENFGVQARVAEPLGILLPLAEIAIGALLIPVATIAAGSLMALVLFAFFVAGVGFALARGLTPECHCFGQLYSRPVSWKTLAQNIALAACVGFVLWADLREPAASIAVFVPRQWNGAAAALATAATSLLLAFAEAWALLHLLRQNGRLLLRMDALERTLGGREAVAPLSAGLAAGSPAPEFALPSLLNDNPVSLGSLRAAGRPVLLVFSDPNCGPCNSLLPDLVRWEKQHAETFSLVVVSQGTRAVNAGKFADIGADRVLLQKGHEISQSFKVAGTPSAVLISPAGTIAAPLAGGPQPIAKLVADTVRTRDGAAPAYAPAQDGAAVARLRKPAGLRPGERAPDIALPDGNGSISRLTDFGGRKRILIFWNFECGFCVKMLPELRRLEREHIFAGDLDAVLVASGKPVPDRDIDLSLPILYDETFAAGRAFHVSGTPSAVLLDANGTIASEIASGAAAILDLIDRQRHAPDVKVALA